jgi:hypothetical protein
MCSWDAARRRRSGFPDPTLDASARAQIVKPSNLAVTGLYYEPKAGPKLSL